MKKSKNNTASIALLLIWAQLLIGFPLTTHTEQRANHSQQHEKKQKDPVYRTSKSLKYALFQIYTSEPESFSPGFVQTITLLKNNSLITQEQTIQACIEAISKIEEIAEEYETKEIQDIYTVLYKTLKRSDIQTRAPRKPNPRTTVDPLAKAPTTFVIPRDVNIERDLNVNGDTTLENLTVNGSIAFPDLNLNTLTLTENPNPACLVFTSSDATEQARICSSGIPGETGIAISSNGGTSAQWELTNSGNIEIENNLLVNGIFQPNTLVVQNSATVNGTTALQATNVNGSLNVNNTSYFNQGVPAIPAEVLQVTKGSISGPNQYNSIKAAVDSITDASATKPYVVQVGAGVFVEDTITMKPYVDLVGDTPDAAIIEVDSTTKDVLIAAHESTLSNITLRGATDSGKAALVYSGGGTASLNKCTFGSSNILIKTYEYNRKFEQNTHEKLSHQTRKPICSRV